MTCCKNTPTALQACLCGKELRSPAKAGEEARPPASIPMCKPSWKPTVQYSQALFMTVAKCYNMRGPHDTLSQKYPPPKDALRPTELATWSMLIV